MKDALKPDSRIITVYDFEIDFEEDGTKISFKADTIFGKTEIEAVM